MKNFVSAKGEDERELMSLAARIPFDDRINQSASTGDLQASLIYSYLRDIKSRLADEATGMDFVQLCRQMNIVDGPAEFLFPRNVGLMFFNEHPERFFPYTQIDVVHFPEGPGASAFTEQSFRSPLNRMIEDALRHLRSTVIREHVVKHGDRAEADRFFNYPIPRCAPPRPGRGGSDRRTRLSCPCERRRSPRLLMRALAWKPRLQIRCTFFCSSRIFGNHSTPPNRRKPEKTDAPAGLRTIRSTVCSCR